MGVRYAPSTQKSADRCGQIFSRHNCGWLDQIPLPSTPESDSPANRTSRQAEAARLCPAHLYHVTINRQHATQCQVSRRRSGDHPQPGMFQCRQQHLHRDTGLRSHLRSRTGIRASGNQPANAPTAATFALLDRNSRRLEVKFLGTSSLNPFEHPL